MKGKKILKFILYFIILLSASLNLYFLIPHKVSESISTGSYLSTDASNGKVYRLSIMQDNKVLLYGPKDDLLEGKLEFVEKENCYLIKTDSNIYQVIASDDTIFLPIIENERIISKLFKKVHDPLPNASLD
ncbi:hypothetical protein SAMN05444401_0711 [Clostridium amylolyticum]|uniref:Uncharacterized protein n=1 Tax=Clostridium amylolyticum TaxID=1121298 RepID=A0A1M6BC96_9CLOT|nr:hypothetical protein [Clostridium amylolyticum]SHI46316.1 hypothetical protein SAMN05444401_0711 [Clostridium amylolyticum]